MRLQSDSTNADIGGRLDLTGLTLDQASNVNMLMQHEEQSGEWIHVRPLEPLKVIIVGGGIGGMTAALALRQQGHHVEIYESSGFSKEIGAALHVAPNANGILKRLGIDCAAIGANECLILSEYNSKGVKAADHDLTKIVRNYEHSWRLAHRVKLHDALRRAATGEAGIGKPAILHLSKAVADVNTSDATVTFKDGTLVQGDVVLGADGVHSVTRTKLPGGAIEPFASGLSAFRFLIPRDVALEDPRTAKYADKDGNMRGFFGLDRSVIMYPTSDNTVLNIIGIHPESASTSTGGWGSNAPLFTMLEVFKDFHPDILALLEKANENSLKVWKLLDMEDLPTWCEGRLALLGDSAHPFLPFLGQGGAIAIEDAVAIGVVLEAGVSKDEIPDRLRLYEHIRKERASLVQEYTRRSGKKRGEKSSFDVAAYQNYCFAHDEFTASHQKLREWKWARSANIAKPMTTVFGPPSFPRRRPHMKTRSTFTTASIRFDTSQAVVKTLLPPGDNSYRFKLPGSIAQCTFSQTTFQGLPWLGGRGYNVLGLYIHGIEHKDANGEVTNGAFSPIVFENMADTNSPQVKVPNAWSAIDVERDRRSYHVRTSWEGLTWGDICLDGLELVTAGTATDTALTTREIPDASQLDKGVLLHHFSPTTVTTTAQDQKSPAGGASFIPHKSEGDESRATPQRKWKAKSASINFNARDWECFPTLHHIISRLQEIHVMNVIEATVVDGHGVPDFA